MPAEIRLAEASEADAIVAMMQELYAADAQPFDARAARRALLELLADPALGSVWLLCEGGEVAGYAVACFGFSLEYHGRDAFLDEIFVKAAHRRRGLATAALARLEAHCREQGIRALHLEVERANEAAGAFYRARGFRGNERRLLTKRLVPDAG